MDPRSHDESPKMSDNGLQPGMNCGTENLSHVDASDHPLSGSGGGGEGTPLTRQGRGRSSGRSRRRRSSAASRILNTFTRAFSIGGASDVLSYNPDDYDVDSAEFGLPPHDIHRQRENRFLFPSVWCRRSPHCTVWIVAVSLTMTVLVLGILLVLIPSSSFDHLHAASHMQDQNGNADFCHPEAGIESLKPSAYLDGLKNGAVASDNPICSKIGRDILMQDGNAVDAAVATVLCLGVANPASSGLGGGAFLLIRSNRTEFEQNDVSSFPDFIDARDDMPERSSDDYMVEVIDCRETAPGQAHQDMYDDDAGVPVTASAIGGLAIATPGELKGLELAHARHGKLSWSTVVDPARKLAQDGFTVSAVLAFEINMTMTLFDQFGDYPALRSHLSRDGNSKNGPLKEGDIFKNPSLARTLQDVARFGSDALYKGKNAERIIADVKDNGGILSVDDLSEYKPVLRTPVYANASGYTLAGVPPPSSGGAALIGAVRFLSGFKEPFARAADTLSVHRMVEAMRHVFAIRMSLSDPSSIFGNGNVTADAVNDLLRGDYMESLRTNSRDNDTLSLSMYGGKKWAQLHDDDGSSEAKDAHEGDRRKRVLTERHRRLAGRPFGYLEDSGTSHVSVVDKDGNSVAVTSSVNGLFGSWVFSESTGVTLGNTMDDFGVPSNANFFGLTPSEANFIRPGKRPLSSMSPTMVFRRNEGMEIDEWGELILTLGGSGGPKIITAVLQVLMNVLFLGMPLFESMAHARVHDQLMYHDAVITATERMTLLQGLTLEVSNRTKNALLRRGHDGLLEIDYTGCVQAIAVDLETGTMSAVSDIRKGGMPSGY